jgi:predicted DNA-binding protein YlxM (UPF0122 family)
MLKREIYAAEYATGKTLREIAEEYGVSWQAVHQGVVRSNVQRPSKWVYPGLVLWMRENGFSVKELAEDIGVSQSALYCWLQGAYKPSKKYIDELLKLTGRTYEELFAAK